MPETVAEQIRFRLGVHRLPEPTERRALRVDAGLTLQEIANVIGNVTPQAVGHWERGLRSPREPLRSRYAAALRALKAAN
ncbi:helix-turn-helix domain-containing protein [Streptomyces sp. bgisy091]|uniref:helix-turn-helix domain-containing protein n=1 Tax=Streptomyces sp. bgisy091 TaxID=3413778 RepID=UPI003D7646F2